MYQNFFGFKERPFKLVPNPAYLYLSRGHEEALAHLSYTIGQGDGFVEITGEVGTGKTTLCRAFLENLSEEGLEAAFIFNPKLDEVQLLKAINDEFGIDSSGETTKDLIDALNEFLLKKKAQGKKAILLIDEAQNLSKDVLEQLRLLSNLETTTSKLIQIILVGQPELGEMLDSHDLRQLGQRITLSCHLSPLNFKETREYILHRLRVAARKEVVQFTLPAILSIFKYSGGIPRLINIACDRALLTAFGLNRKKVTVGIALSAIRELADRRRVGRMGFGLLGGKWWAAVAAGVVVLAAGLLYLGDPEDDSSLQASTTARQEIKAPEEEPQGRAPGVAASGQDFPAQETAVETAPPPGPEVRAALPMPPAKTEQVREEEPPAPVKAPVEEAFSRADTADELERILAATDVRSSRNEALAAVLSLWVDEPVLSPYLAGVDRDEEFFAFTARQNGLHVNRVHHGDLALLRKFNMPAILKMKSGPDGGTRYLVLSRMKEGEAELRGGGLEGKAVRVPGELLESGWSGEAFILWKNFLNIEGVVPTNTTRESIVNLRMLLRDIGFENIEITPYYDTSVRDAVKVIQKRNGVSVDGVVGPVTKIILYNEKPTLPVPRVFPVAESRVDSAGPAG